MSQVRSVTRVSGSDKGGVGAAEGIRTPDPRITNALLYQLSYRGVPAIGALVIPGTFKGKARVGKGHLRGASRRQCVGASARSLKRWILPVAVFGNSVRNSTQRGYLKTASFSRQ
jgi:hypothetical protein